MELYNCVPSAQEIAILNQLLSTKSVEDTPLNNAFTKILSISKNGSIYLLVTDNGGYSLGSSSLILGSHTSNLEPRDVSLIGLILLIRGLHTEYANYLNQKKFPMEYFDLLTTIDSLNQVIGDKYCIYTTLNTQNKNLLESFLFTNTRGNISVGTPGNKNLVLYKFDKKDNPRISTWNSPPSSITRKNYCSGIEVKLDPIDFVQFWMSLLPHDQRVRGSVLINLIELKELLPKLEFDFYEITTKLDIITTNKELKNYGKEMSAGSSCNTCNSNQLQGKEARHSDGSVPVGSTVYGRRRRTSIEIGYLSHQTIIGDR